jgi:hypothetical protein
MDLLKVLSDNLKVFITGWKNIVWPAEPFINVFTATIPAVIGSTLNNQALDLRLPYDLYVRGVGIFSTGLFSFLLKFSGGGVLLGNAQIRSTTLWSAQNPVLWFPRPFKIAAGASLSVDLTNLIAGTNTVEIDFIGWKGANPEPGVGVRASAV